MDINLKMNNINFSPLYLSLYLSFISTFMLIIISLPISWWLSQTKNTKIKKLTETLIALPLVLPPTILGFYLLLLFNPNTIVGKTWFFFFGTNLAFSMTGLIIGSIIYSLPFAIQPTQMAFEKIEKQILNQALILQCSKLKIFLKIVIPLSKNGIITSIILSFAHTLGEFGVVLMIGGNIPGKTQVISIAIYETVELLDYSSTHILSLIVLLISFIILFILFNINKKNNEQY